MLIIKGRLTFSRFYYFFRHVWKLFSVDTTTHNGPDPGQTRSTPDPVAPLPGPILERPSGHQARRCPLISISLNKGHGFYLQIFIHFAKRQWCCNSIAYKYSWNRTWASTLLRYKYFRHKVLVLQSFKSNYLPSKVLEIISLSYK